MAYLDLTDLIVGTLTHDTLRYALGAGGTYLIVNTLLAHRLRTRKIRAQTPRWPQIRRELLTSIRTVLIFAATGMLIGLAHASGLMPIYATVSDFGWPYLLASLVLIIVAHDAWFYWMHRLIHHRRLFRLMHRTHHRSHAPTPFTSYAFDISEAVLNAMFLPLFLLLIPMHPLAILAFLFHMMLRNALGHCGYEVFPARADGRPLLGWMTTVTHHDLHHADGRYNMGLYFTWWDRIMGTEHPRYHQEFARVARPLKSPARGIAALILLTGAFVMTGTTAKSTELRGIYSAPFLGAVVRFAPCRKDQGAICGTLLWGWDATQWRHARPGDMIITGLKPDARGWAGGRLRHPETGLSFKGRVTHLPDGRLRLQGCAGPFCATQIWVPLGHLTATLAGLD